MSLSPGDHLGPYEILARIGAGGMGEVWKARDTRLIRTVAIKRVKRDHAGRFEQEARAVAALNHPHICQIYDIGPDYLVLEFVDGEPLTGPVDDPLRVALQIASALEAAHAKGILHRDLKPGNILMTPAGPKLLDFGLAKITGDGDATQTIGVSGTPLYMSPEQAEGQALDARSDIFSFGAVLYELISGHRAVSTLAAVLRDAPKPLQSPLAEIVHKCLAKKPADRFQTIAELRKALESAATKPLEEQPSIAVLPFANMSSDKEQEYFSDGLAEEILNLLAKIPGLKVIARTSSFAFRGKEEDITKIAEALRVTTILEGSVRKAGNRIRVTAQLINAKDGAHLWSERYDRELTDVFEVQDEVASAIAAVLQAKLTTQAAAPRHYVPKLEAYEAYLKARYYQWKVTPENFARSQEYYERAIASDPNYALAWVGYADLLLLRVASGGEPAHELMPQVRGAAGKALKLDARLPEANAMMGIVSGAYEYDWKATERFFQLALTPEPVSPLVRSWYAVFYLLPMGRREESVEECRRAVQEDPLSTPIRFSLTVSLIASADWSGAQAEARELVEIAPAFPGGFNILALMLARQGDLREAIEMAERVRIPAPGSEGILAGLPKRNGDSARAEEFLGKIHDLGGIREALGRVNYHLACGEPAESARWADKLVEERYPGVVTLIRIWESLYPGPWWTPVTKKMKLPEPL